MKITIHESQHGEFDIDPGELEKKLSRAFTATKKAMLPLQNPLFNVREAAKQLVLLEDHLSQTEKQCPDCIRKHILTAEALLEEAVTLDEDGKHTWLRVLPAKVREFWNAYLNKEDFFKTAQAVRALRKELVDKAGDTEVIAKSCEPLEKSLSIKGGEIDVLEELTQQVTGLYQERMNQLRMDLLELHDES